MRLTAKEARRIWRYEPLTGKFYWRVKVTDKTVIDNIAGSAATNGYWQLKYQGYGYRAARVAWLIMTGEWPHPQVDHINGNRRDDRFSNLRESTQQQNMQNRAVQGHNKSGLKGVWSRPNGKYAAYISLGDRMKYLGEYSKASDAKAAYDSAALRLHGEFFKS